MSTSSSSTTSIAQVAKTRSISMTDADWRAAKELANSNTNGNISELLARLVHFATMMPERFDFQQPSPLRTTPTPKPTINEVIAEASKLPHQGGKGIQGPGK